MPVGLQGKHAAPSSMCMLQAFHTDACVRGQKVTAIIISVTHHCWGNERGEEELQIHAVERERAKRQKKGGFRRVRSAKMSNCWGRMEEFGSLLKCNNEEMETWGGQNSLRWWRLRLFTCSILSPGCSTDAAGPSCCTLVTKIPYKSKWYTVRTTQGHDGLESLPFSRSYHHPAPKIITKKSHFCPNFANVVFKIST